MRCLTNLVQRAKVAPGRITQLLSEVQTHWTLVAQFYKPGQSDSRLQQHAESFFE
jgi:hypothetical protein